MAPGAEYRAVRFEHEETNLWVTVSQDTLMGQVNGERSVVWGPVRVGWPAAQVSWQDADVLKDLLLRYAKTQAYLWDQDTGTRHPVMDRL
jgi:hypothetical protein